MAAHVYYLHIIVTAECFSNILDLPAFMMCSEQLGIIHNLPLRFSKTGWAFFGRSVIFLTLNSTKRDSNTVCTSLVNHFLCREMFYCLVLLNC